MRNGAQLPRAFHSDIPLSECLTYRALFRGKFDSTAIDDIRLALKQNQPLGNARS